MFEAGKRYEFRMIEDGGEVLFWDTVDRYEHPLLKMRDLPERDIGVRIMPGNAPGEGPGRAQGRLPAQPGKIINVTSPNFISAVEQA